MSIHRKSKPNYDGYDCVAQSFSGDVLGEWTVERCDTDLNYICKARKGMACPAIKISFLLQQDTILRSR